jgi:hypothetical protein
MDLLKMIPARSSTAQKKIRYPGNKHWYYRQPRNLSAFTSAAVDKYATPAYCVR